MRGSNDLKMSQTFFSELLLVHKIKKANKILKKVGNMVHPNVDKPVGWMLFKIVYLTVYSRVFQISTFFEFSAAIFFLVHKCYKKLSEKIWASLEVI